MLYRLAVLLAIATLSLTGCSIRNKIPRETFATTEQPEPPNYDQYRYWAALPFVADAADSTPGDSLQDGQTTAQADVFFIHPTIYAYDRDHRNWNGPLLDIGLNEAIADGTIKNQASVFNAAGRVYAPRYRQAHIHAYHTEDKASAKQAFDLAYEDVRAAFQFYLDHYNHGRPIIIAAHSQGTTHGKRLVREYFDRQPLDSLLVAAYLVGIPVPKGYFQEIEVCDTPTQTGCFVSWRTWKRGHTPDNYTNADSAVVVNPLTWTTAPELAPASLNRGTVLLDFDDEPTPDMIAAQIHNGLLWTNKPEFFGSIFFTTKNYHIADYNFFYMNVRQNAVQRVEAFLQSSGSRPDRPAR